MASLRFARSKGAEVVAECLDKLNEKRRATREEGMKGLIGALEGFVPVDELDHLFLTVMDRCCDSIRKGAAREATLAYRAVGLFALTVASAGADRSKEILEKALPILEKTIQASFDEVTLVAALDCLAAVAFACTRHPEDTERPIMAMLGVIINPGSAPNLVAGSNGKTSPKVPSAAVSAWALLLTTLGDVTTNSSAWKQTMMPLNDLATLLESDDPSVRMAVGEALAVCVELDLTQHASPEDMEALEVQVSALAFAVTGQELTQEEQQLFHQITALLSHHGGCPDRRSLDSSLSGFGVLTKSAWARKLQNKFLERFLAKGFRKHLQDNPFLGFLREETSSAGGDEISAPREEKTKLGKKGREKQWSAAMKRDRAIGWEYKNSFSLFP